MIKRLSKGIDICFLLLVVLVFCVYTYQGLFIMDIELSEYVLVFLLFILIVLSYFTNLLIALIASAIFVFIFGVTLIYFSFVEQTDITGSYFWIIVFPLCGLVSGSLGDKLLTLFDKATDLEARVANYLSYDEDTGFGNSMALSQYLRKILSSSKRHGYSVSLIGVEFKYYKSMYSKYGKEKFNIIFRTFSNIIHEELRLEDSPYRIDDARFIIVLENTDLLGANIVRSRLKDKLRNKVEIDIGDTTKDIRLKAKLSAVMYDRDSGFDAGQFIDLAIKELEYDVE